MKIRNQKRIRFISAIILLMVMMLQVGVKTLHQHQHVEKEHISCSDCEHHRVHSGHIINYVDDGDCFLCQIISTPFCEAKCVRLNIIPAGHPSYSIYYNADFVCVAQTNVSPRAPPVFQL